MKKKFLLAIIPALMALSSCGHIENSTNVKENDFLEDCLAHDELFGNVELQVENQEVQRAKQPLRAPNPEFDPEESFQHPSIGVQTFFDGDHTVSFRFVAVVHFDSVSARENSNAVWTRCVSKTDCSSYPLDDATPAPEVTKAYTSLNNNGVIYSITDYNNDHKNEYEQPAGYTHFVVYTLRNIDLNKYAGSDYYVSAYLSMSGSVGSISSKAIAIRFDREKKYSYVQEVGTGFLEYTTGSTTTVIEKTVIENDGNAASFEGKTASKDDTFVIKAFDGTKLKIWNASNFTGENNHSDYYFTNDNGKMKAKFNGTYNLYLNSSHNVYISATAVKRPLYAKPTNVGGLDSWWGQNGRWTALYAYNEDVNPKREAWFVLEADGNYLKTTEEVDSSLYNKAIFVEMKSGTSTPSWNNKNDNNETSNQAISLTFEDCAYLKDNGSGGKYFDWGARS